MPCPKKVPKEMYKKKIETDKRRKHFFHTFLYLLGEGTNQRYVLGLSVVPKTPDSKLVLSVLGLQSAVLHLGSYAGCASALEISSGLRGPSPLAFTPFWGVYCVAPEVPQKGECLRGPKVFSA